MNTDIIPLDRADTMPRGPSVAEVNAMVAELDRLHRRKARPRLRRTMAIFGGLVLLAAVMGAGWAVQRADNAQPAPAALAPPAAAPRPATARHVSAPTPSPSPAYITPAVVLYACEGQAVTEPAAYIIACGDGNAGLSDLTWSSWTDGGAQATGQYYQNDCTPDCADGTFRYVPATVTLSDPLTSPDDGKYFSSLVISETGLPDYGTITLGPDGPGQ
jgi:hypothetical protein